MLADDLANLSEQVLGEGRIPAELRCVLALVLAEHAHAARAMENALVPASVRAVPTGCVDLGTERFRRATRARAEARR